MTLTCSQPSRYRFSPGRSYVVQPGGRRESEYYVDVVDDEGRLQRFATKPCAHVGNEHPLAELAQAFPLPADARPARELSVWREIREQGFERPLVLVPRGEAKQWVLAFAAAASTETRVITSASALNSLIVHGLPRAIYVSTHRALFVGLENQPLPTTLELFDALFDISSVT